MSRRFGEKSVRRWLAGEIDDARFLGLCDEDYRELLFRAHRRFEAGDLTDAERIFGWMHRIWPDAPEPLLGLGACRQVSGDLNDALGFYERSLALRPGDPFAAANRAECLLLLGRAEEAKAALALLSADRTELSARIEALRRLAPT